MPHSCIRARKSAGGLAAILIALSAINGVAAHQCLSATTPCCPGPRPQDQVWLVDSRGACSCDVEQNVQQLKYWRYDCELGWTAESLEALLATDDAQVVTTVFLHGNRIERDEAFTKGWSAYRSLTRFADERPIRFVIWSWPSEKVCGPIEDARVKAARTNPAGYYLAWFLDQLDPDVPVSLWGHSFGARIATGALHQLGGGEVCGNRLATRVHPGRRPVQVVLLAAAVDDHWLLPGHRHGDALSQVDAMLLVNNGCDRLLKRYQLLYPGRGCEQALGYSGLAVHCLKAEDAEKVDQIDACCQVGRQHQFLNYLESPHLLARMRGYLLFENLQPTAASPPAEDEVAQVDGASLE